MFSICKSYLSYQPWNTPQTKRVDYTSDRLIRDESFRRHILSQICKVMTHISKPVGGGFRRALKWSSSDETYFVMLTPIDICADCLAATAVACLFLCVVRLEWQSRKPLEIHKMSRVLSTPMATSLWCKRALKFEWTTLNCPMTWHTTKLRSVNQIAS